MSPKSKELDFPNQQHLKNLTMAIELYESLGYRLIHTPWVVGQECIEATAPAHTTGNLLKQKYPNSNTYSAAVGSAEQGFLAKMRSLTPGCRYMSLTPCFRDEGRLLDFKLRWPYFLKLELFVPHCVPKEFKPLAPNRSIHLETSIAIEIKEHAEVVMSKIGRNLGPDVEIETLYPLSQKLSAYLSEEQEIYHPNASVMHGPVDLTINKIEVGSYGTLHNNGYIWSCGTGLAEPRFTYATHYTPNRWGTTIRHPIQTTIAFPSNSRWKLT